MTGYYVRIGSENKEITTLTAEDWNQLMMDAARQGDGAAGWRWAMSLARWIKENVIVMVHRHGEGEVPLVHEDRPYPEKIPPSNFNFPLDDSGDVAGKPEGIPASQMTCANCGERYERCKCPHFMPAQITPTDEDTTH